MLATVATLLFVPVVFSLVHGREKTRCCWRNFPCRLIKNPRASA